MDTHTDETRWSKVDESVQIDAANEAQNRFEARRLHDNAMPNVMTCEFPNLISRLGSLVLARKKCLGSSTTSYIPFLSPTHS